MNRQPKRTKAWRSIKMETNNSQVNVSEASKWWRLNVTSFVVNPDSTRFPFPPLNPTLLLLYSRMHWLIFNPSVPYKEFNQFRHSSSSSSIGISDSSLRRCLVAEERWIFCSIASHSSSETRVFRWWPNILLTTWLMRIRSCRLMRFYSNGKRCLWTKNSRKY